MGIGKKAVRLKEHLGKRYFHYTAVGSVALMSNPVFAADYNVTEVVSDLEAGEAPVATVAASTVGVLVVRRVWKLIKGSI